MILALVTFPAPATPLSAAEQRSLLEATSPAYRQVPGLRRKYFIASKDSVGGAYEWASRADADAFYNESWQARMQSRYGQRPEVRYFDAPCVVDNERGVIDFP